MVYRWEYMDADVLKKLLPPMPWYAIPLYRYYLKKQTHAQGMGRHTLQELQHIGLLNLRELSDFMGMYSGADPGFPVGGGANPRGGGANIRFCQILRKTA